MIGIIFCFYLGRAFVLALLVYCLLGCFGFSIDHFLTMRREEFYKFISQMLYVMCFLMIFIFLCKLHDVLRN